MAIAPSDAPPASPTANSDVSFVYGEACNVLSLRLHSLTLPLQDSLVSSRRHNTTVGSDDGREYSKDRKQVVLASFSSAPLSEPDVAPYTSRTRASPSTVGHGVAMRKAETSGTFTDALQGPYLYVIDLVSLPRSIPSGTLFRGIPHMFHVQVARTADENMFKLVPDTGECYFSSYHGSHWSESYNVSYKYIVSHTGYTIQRRLISIFEFSWLLGEDPDIHYSADGSQTTANTQAFERSFPNLNPSHAYLPGHVENYPDDHGNVNREEGVYAKRVVYSDETVACRFHGLE